MAMAGDHHPQQQQQEQQTSSTSRIVGIKELVDAGLKEVPPIYVCPPQERPSAATCFVPDHINDDPQYHMPVIDVATLYCSDGDGAARAELLNKLARGCEEWGFFQVVNHGVELGVIQALRDAALRFFDQPAKVRMRFHEQSSAGRGAVAYTTSFNPGGETVRYWRDTLRFHRFPGICDGFVEAPDICRKELLEYIKGVEALATSVYSAIFESLGVDKEYVQKEVPSMSRVHMGINYYPPCPDPRLALGLNSHSDVSSLTVLHPDVVPGLQIKHKGTWVPVFPEDASAFVINLGDQIEIMTNGKYKSVEHRVLTNRESPRMSIACFFGPLDDTIVAPLSALLDEENPPRYKPTKFSDYNANFYSNGLRSDCVSLDFARI